MNLKRGLAGLLAGLFLANACEYYVVPERGKTLLQVDVDTITRGTTTKKEVETRFGKPDARQLTPSGEPFWQYCHSPGGRVEHLSIQGQSSDNRRWKCLSIVFSLDGIVKDYVFREFSAGLDQYDKQGGLWTPGRVQLYP